MKNKKTQIYSFNKSSPHPISIDTHHGMIEAYGQKSPFRSDKNEDGHFILSNGQNTFLAVADGVGGSPKGQEASSLVLQIIYNELKSLSTESTRPQITKKIEQSFAKANSELQKNYRESATTLILAWINDRVVQFFYCGDSEGLIIGTKGEIKYRTVPHTPAGEDITNNKISWHEMSKHPERNIVTNYLGHEDMAIETPPSFILNDLDTVIVCSDGLTDNAGPDELSRLNFTVNIKETIENVRDKMINSREGKPDDCTILRFGLKKLAS